MAEARAPPAGCLSLTAPKVNQVTPRDTAAEAAHVYRMSYQALSGSERVERAMKMAEDVKEITLAGIRYRHPEYSPDQVHHEWLSLLHTRVIADRLM